MKRWSLWLVLAVVAGVGIALLLIVAAVIGWQFVPHRTEVGEKCTTGLGMNCTQVRPEVIERLAAMRLPAGTTVHESSYESFQDWRLAARFSVPADRVFEWEESVSMYRPVEDCAALEGEGADRRCAAGPEGTSPIRRYARVTRPDGSVLVAVEVFRI